MFHSTERLLECVFKFPILYDINHKDYKNLKKRDQIWDEIGKELEIPGENVKKKWKNLRDTYAKYLRSTKINTGNSKKNYKRWYWASHMERFKPFLDKTETNVAPLTTEITLNDILDNNESQENEQSEEELEESDGKRRLCKNLVEDEEIPETTIVRKKAIKRPNPESNINEVVKYLERESKQRKDIDAVDHFMLSLAKTIKQFTPKRQAETKMEIAQIIFRKEMEQIEETN